MSCHVTSRRIALAGLLGLAMLLPACTQGGNFTVFGYTTKPNYNTEYHTVHVPIFKNRTFEHNLERDLTQEVVRQINLKTPYRVVPCWQDADTELTGTIANATKSILNRNQLNEIREAETALAVELVWRDLRTGEILSGKKRADQGVALNTQIPSMPAISGDPNDLAMFAPPPPDSPDVPTLLSGIVVARSTAHFIPELGESITTAHQKNVQRMATQIVSLMESAW
jgi:hypothetical protein